MLIVLLALALVAVVVRKATAKLPVSVVAVDQGVVKPEVFGPGTVESRYPVSVGSRIAGAVDRVLVDVGDEVEKGRLLATLDRTELDARTETVRRAVTAARQDVAIAEASLAKAESDLALARSNHERSRALLGTGSLPVETFDQTLAALGGAEANRRVAHVSIDGRRADLAGLLAQERVAVTLASYTQITSPMAGVITKRVLEPGSTVSPGTPIFEMVDANALWIASRIDESLTGSVRAGQEAIIHVRSGAQFTGHVSRVPLQADLVTRELEVDVAFDQRPPRFAIHEEADVTIIGEERRGLLIPETAVLRGDDGARVFVVEGGRARMRSVHLGSMGGGRMIVLDGLREGETVVVEPKDLSDGQRVAPRAGG